jgi:electron transfer flavoprotein beta subunit
LKIGICAKVTPTTDARPKASADGGSFEVQGKVVVGPYDEFAVEEAVKTKEKAGGELVVYSVGSGADTVAQLRIVIALGADRAVLVDDAATRNTDSLGVAKALAAAARRDGMEILFCGKQAIDDDNSQVPAMVAELLGWAHVSRVVEFAIDGTTFRATRSMDGGVREVVSGSLPVVITAERGLNKPRAPKLPAVVAAKNKPFATVDLAALGLSAADVAPKAITGKYGPPPERPKGRILQGDADTAVKELVRLLREEAKVL